MDFGLFDVSPICTLTQRLFFSRRRKKRRSYSCGWGEYAKVTLESGYENLSLSLSICRRLSLGRWKRVHVNVIWLRSSLCEVRSQWRRSLTCITHEILVSLTALRKSNKTCHGSMMHCSSCWFEQNMTFSKLLFPSSIDCTLACQEINALSKSSKIFSTEMDIYLFNRLCAFRGNKVR